MIAATANIDRGSQPIAETYRRVALIAERLGLARPSYESVRLLVHDLRARKRDPEIGQILLDISFRRRPPEALADALAGIPLPRLTK